MANKKSPAVAFSEQRTQQRARALPVTDPYKNTMRFCIIGILITILSVASGTNAEGVVNKQPSSDPKSGKDVIQDFDQAARWLQMAVATGNVQAQYNLGVLYLKGNGADVRQDYVEAVKWFKLAAEQGFAHAQYNLGLMYGNGQGVQKDHTEAAKWYRLAAAQGLADAQNNLGVMYSRGQGVQQDYAEAARWYRSAAEKGFAPAQYNLGVKYGNGQDMPRPRTISESCTVPDWE
jgi:TPR repeat protein